MNLQKAINLYPTARRAMKRVLMKALNDEHGPYAGDIAGNAMTLGSDAIIKTIAEGDAAYGPAKYLQADSERNQIPFWDEEISIDNIDAVRRAAEVHIFDQDPDESERMLEGWRVLIRSAETILQLTKYIE